MAAPERFYITTPIYYVNDKPHIGHAYTTLACDVMARFHRLDGRAVHFLTGTDEHGQKVAKSAREHGVEPQAFVDAGARQFQDMAGVLGCSHDDFIRTTQPRHLAACQALWKTLQDNGQIYAASYPGWYAVRDEAFYDEAETRLDGGRRIAIASGAEVEWVEEPSYFFKLSEWGEKLLAFYEANPHFIRPASRRNEVISFVKGGLRDLSISRTSFTWGVPVPGDDKHVMYVWLDALTNYMTAVGYPDLAGDSYRRWWPADIHVVGKDILRFHAVYWPAFLMAAGLEPPRQVFAHGWWTIEGQKMSKSLGNVIDPTWLIGKYGLDPVRYFLMRELPFGQDGDFSHKAMVGRLNGDLANDFGNLAQRVLSMIAKNCGGQVPARGPETEADLALLGNARSLLADLRALLDRRELHQMLVRQWDVVAAANRYVDEQAPWALKKTDPARMAMVLWVLAETLRHLGLLVQPFLPGSGTRLLDQLAVPAGARSFAALTDAFALVPGTPLPAPQGLFPRWVEDA